jgi:hypothetical protein
VGRPRKEETKPERVMVFDTETGEMRRAEDPEPEPEQEPEQKRERKSEKKPQPETKIEPGNFLVRFD